MDQRRTGADCARGAHNRWQYLVIDRDQLRRVARLGFRRGNDDSDALADIADALDGEWRPLSSWPTSCLPRGIWSSGVSAGGAWQM